MRRKFKTTATGPRSTSICGATTGSAWSIEACWRSPIGGTSSGPSPCSIPRRISTNTSRYSKKSHRPLERPRKSEASLLSVRQDTRLWYGSRGRKPLANEVSRTPAAPGAPHLRRVLGAGDLVLLFVVAIVNLNVVPTIAANGGVTVWLWSLALLLFFWPQGIAVIELAHRYPGEGGVYLWAKRVFGDFHGFLSGWCYWTNNIFYVPTVLLYFVGISVYVAGPRARTLADNHLFALGASILLLVLLAALNVRGLGVVKAVSHMAEQVQVPWIVSPFALVLSISIAGIASAWLSGSARIPFVAGLDLYLPEGLGKLHKRFATPYVALIVHASFSAIFLAMSFVGAGVKEAFVTMLDLAVVLQLVPFLYMHGALLKLAKQS